MGFFDSVKSSVADAQLKAKEVHLSLNVVSGKSNLGMSGFSNTIVMRQNDANEIYFDTKPGDFFKIVGYKWDGPKYKTVTTSQEQGNAQGKTKSKGSLGGAVVGTLLLPGIGTAIGYSMGKKSKGNASYDKTGTIEENQVEDDGVASIQLRNIDTGNVITFGFTCNSKVDIDLQQFDLSLLPTSNTTVVENVSTQSDKIRLLKEYKALFDEGVISEEEFNAKKAELL